MNNYIKQAIRTNTDLKHPIGLHNQDLIHAAFGLCSEAGELIDQIKRHFFYGKPLDIVNIKEEMGDMFWYLAILADWLECDFSEIMTANIEKLKVRYPEKFSMDKALHRDLNAERKVLEQKKG